MSELRFVEDKHEYYFHNVLVPSVTQIIDSFDFVNKDFFTEFHATRGRYVHKASTFVDKNTLNWDDLDPELGGYVRGYAKFVEEHQPEWFMSEERIFNKPLFYAGTLDRYGTVDGHSALVDLKTGAVSKLRDALQMAGYGYDVNSEAALLCLHLTSDGDYRIHDYTDPELFLIWESAVRLYHYRRRK